VKFLDNSFLEIPLTSPLRSQDYVKPRFWSLALHFARVNAGRACFGADVCLTSACLLSAVGRHARGSIYVISRFRGHALHFGYLKKHSERVHKNP
jgi:hypothetical protein